MFDPHEKYFSTVEERKSGTIWNFEREGVRCIIQDYRNQFEPLMNIFGKTSKNGYCDGTLFRFPLRQAPSKLSETVYNDEKVSTLFNSFKNEGHLALLFLKSLERIEFYRRSDADSRPELLLSFSIEESCLEVLRPKRKKFLEMLIKAQTENDATVISETFDMTIVSKFFQVAYCTTNKSQQYLVAKHYDGEAFLKNMISVNRGEMLPLVGVAFLLNHGTAELRKGHIFCALPLPAQKLSPTGLPIHVNGYFALNPDRKDLKWLSAAHDEVSVVSDRKIRWNQFLISTVLPCAYVKLICEIISRQNSSAVYQAWPNMNDVNYNWMPLLETSFEKLFKYGCLKTAAFGGKWVKVGEAVFVGGDVLNVHSETGRKVACSCITRGGLNSVNVPTHVEECLNQFYKGTRKKMDPALVSQTLRRNPDIILCLTSSDKLDLLDYLLYTPNVIQSLTGVSLLPLENGNFVPFDLLSEAVYITSDEFPKSLFPGFSHRILLTEISITIKKTLERAAEEGEWLSFDHFKATFVVRCFDSYSSQMNQDLHPLTKNREIWRV